MNNRQLLGILDSSWLEVSISPAALSIRKKKIAQSMGYGESTIPEYFSDIIDSVLIRLPEMCTIVAGYRIVSVAAEIYRSDGLLVDGTFYTMQSRITSHLRKAEKAALFVCTIGEAMDDWAASLFSMGDGVTGHFVDTIASLIVENAADYLHRYIKEQVLSHSLRVTNRYSPGYCGWSVAEQHLLFASIPAKSCGVTLTESALMIPKKSVSGIIGIGTAVNEEDYFCNQCRNSSCSYHSYLAAHKK